MKRPQLLFVTVVFGAVLVGFLLEHRPAEDPFAAREFSLARRIPFEPLAPPIGTLALAGQVVDESGAPAPGIAVHLLPADPAVPAGAEADAEEARPLAWTTTDAAGSFQLSGLSAGDYRAVLLEPGRRSAELPISLPAPGPVRWQLGAPFPPIAALPEVERAALLGRLLPPVTAGDAPVAGYEVVLRPAPDAELWSGAVTRRMVTDEEGFFELPDVVLGRYVAQVLPAWASGGTWPVLDEVRYEHRAGGLERLSLRLSAGEIGGRALDLDLRPLSGALVLAWPADRPDEPWPAVSTDANGEFLVRDLPLGRYTVRIQAGGARYEETVQVQIGSRTRVLPPPLATDGAIATTSPAPPPATGH